MEQSEIENLVGELELRVDRLRSLYDQYFMGIEKTTPSVPHKDVDRRIQLLRKEQIRNTGLRFRFQMVVQRYNTYQSYWMRITRQIEEGTYKRDLVRAKRRAAVPETKAKERVSDAPESVDVVVSEPPTAPAAVKAEGPSPIPLQLDGKVDEPRPRAGAPRPAPPKVPPAAGSRPVVPPAPGSVSIPGTGPRPVWRKVGAAPGAGPPAPTLAFKPAPPAVTRPPPGAAIPAVTSPPRPPPVPTAAAKPAPAQPAPAERPKPAPTPLASASAPRPPVPTPAARPQPAPPAPAKKPGDISDDRMRQLYSDYVETRRSQKESTASVTYDALARTVRDSTAKLKEKHGGKSVDFEVTVKDGKTILKPVVK